MRDLYILAPLLIAIISAGLGFFVYERDTRHPRNYFFLALSCVFILINLFEIKAVMATSAAGARSYLIAQALPFIFLPPVLFCFANAYNNFVKIEPEWLYWLINAPFIVVFLAFARLVEAAAIKFSVIALHGGFCIHAGIPAAYIVPAYALALTLSLWPFVKCYRLRSTDHAFYEEAVSVFYALAIPAALALAFISYFNFVHAASAAKAFVYPLGVFPAAVAAAVALLTVSIVKYRSFNISIMFNNALVYSMLAVIISGVYVIIQNFLENFFQSIFKSSSDAYGIISALVVAFLFEPLNRKLNDFINNIIDFFKSINNPIASETEGRNLTHFSSADLKALEIAYIVFIFCFMLLLFTAPIAPVLSPRATYMISAMTLSLSALYILYRILHLPFNLTAYAALSIFFIFTHVLFVTLTMGSGFYFEAAGALVSLICLISAAGLVGRIIAVRIDEIAFLIPLCLVAAAADAWSVFFGVTSEMITKKSAALDYLLLRYPTLGVGHLKQYIGISDFLFATILMGCALNFKLNAKKTYLAVAVSFFATFATVVLTYKGIPAIPYICFAFIAVNAPRLRVKYEDIKAMLIVLFGAGAVFYIISTLRRIMNN